MPEILHGMGIVYWHQSLMQVMLPLQLLLYYNMRYKNNKIAKYVFYIITVINPYIEWTGYVANFSYVLAEFIHNGKKNIKQSVISTMIIGCLTLLSFGIFILHYIMRIKPNILF